jgi:hypothetical protein
MSAVDWSAGILPALAGIRIGDWASPEAGKMPALHKTRTPQAIRQSNLDAHHGSPGNNPYIRRYFQDPIGDKLRLFSLFSPE